MGVSIGQQVCEDLPKRQKVGRKRKTRQALARQPASPAQEKKKKKKKTGA